MFSRQIQGVIRAFTRTDSISFQSELGVMSAVQAVDMGLCRLVRNQSHQVTMRDRHWNVTLGIELTDAGEVEMARIT